MKKFKSVIALVLVCLLSVGSLAELTNFPNGVSSFGIPLVGSGPVLTTGKVWFVSSSNALIGNDRYEGSSERPFKTLDYAVGRSGSSKGDVIFVMPGHSEQISATSPLNLDVNGISVIGIGNGDLRPLLTVGTTTVNSIALSGSDIKLENLRFTPGIDALKIGINVTGDDATIRNCEFNGTSAIQADEWIVVTNNVSRFKLVGNKVRQTTAGGITFLRLGSPAYQVAIEEPYIGYNDIIGNFTLGIVNDNATANNMIVEYNILETSGGCSVNVSLNAVTTGVLNYNSLIIKSNSGEGLDYITPSTNTKVKLIENYGSNFGGTYGRIVGQ